MKLNNNYTYEMNENNPEMDYMENQLDISQKKYLENYKSFLSELDNQLTKWNISYNNRNLIILFIY